MSENWELYTAGKKFTLPPALTGWANSTSRVYSLPYTRMVWSMPFYGFQDFQRVKTLDRTVYEEKCPTLDVTNWTTLTTLTYHKIFNIHAEFKLFLWSNYPHLYWYSYIFKIQSYMRPPSTLSYITNFQCSAFFPLWVFQTKPVSAIWTRPMVINHLYHD